MSYIILASAKKQDLEVVCKKCGKLVLLKKEIKDKSKGMRKYEGCCGNEGIDMASEDLYDYKIVEVEYWG